MSIRVAVFASGSGSNLQAILDHQQALSSPCWRVGLVISDRDGVGALGRAAKAGVEARVIPVAGRSAGEVSVETLDLLHALDISFVALAGYLRLVPGAVVSEFQRRIVNIHPALLPSFGGKGMYGSRVHAAVLEAGVSVTGPTVHFVDEEYDRGTVVAQWPVPVLADDNADAVAARVLRVEHLLYPRVVNHLCTALSEGTKATPFAPSGDAFVAGATHTGEDLARAIESGFENARANTFT